MYAELRSDVVRTRTTYNLIKFLWHHFLANYKTKFQIIKHNIVTAGPHVLPYCCAVHHSKKNANHDLHCQTAWSPERQLVLQKSGWDSTEMKKVIIAGSLRKLRNNFCFDFKVTFRGCEADSC